MKFQTGTALMVLLGVASARPDASRRFAPRSRVMRREVPQEHSHENVLTVVNEFLKKDNPDNISDAVFGLLGNKAAAEGAGDVTDLDCLHQRTADQAFTNAKAENDVNGMAMALIWRAVERNSAKVGAKSVLCTEKAKNPEIDALQQHQDPASEGAAELNKQIALDLAVQLNSVGADPNLAILSGTFEPGDVNDPTGAGNSCDDIDPKGCINTKNLLVPDVTEDEIAAAVAAAGSGAGAGAGTGASNSTIPATGRNSTGNANAGNNASCGAASGNATGNTGNNNTSAGGASGAFDTGSCGSAAIKFAVGLDGRKDASFAPVNGDDFNHGSAQKPGIITSFICQQLGSKCKASQASVDQCETAAKAADALTGQAAADAFNSGVGA